MPRAAPKVLSVLQQIPWYQTVLNGINLEVAQGETLSVLGRSGTGKSVLLKLIIGLYKPDSDSIHVNGEDVTKLPLKELNEVRKKVGFLFQHAALYDSLTVEENVAFLLRRHSKSLAMSETNACANSSQAWEWTRTPTNFLPNSPVECKNASAWRAPWLWSPISSSDTPRDVTEETGALTNEAREGLTAFRDNMEALQHNFLLRGFFEKRGYNDTSESTQHSISRLPTRTPAKEFNYDAKDIFAKTDSAKLKNEKPLDEVGKYLEKNKVWS